MILTEDVLQRYRANQGYVYLIHAVGTDRYKIGRSVNPPARLETLKKQSPYPLQIIECFWTPDAIADEKYFHNREYLAPHRKFGEWFEVSNERDDTLSLSSFDVLELEFTGHRPTCRQYLMQSFQSVIADSGLPTDGNYFNQAYSPIRLLYLGVTNIPALERIIFFTFNKLPSIVGNCRDSQELENTCWAACETASQLILGQELFDIAESLVRYKGK
ncbi:MAG: GIY-YIG nuclease family protein [Tolypothrix brevis GSE-NOS-MK-07-07A]|nr:GIY-YIG nuclease family protein [Tolypothrix brevis GSE-NOS-MK-07-07A]